MTASPSTQPAIFSRVLPSRLGEIEGLSQALSDWLEEHGAPLRAIASISLMLDELFTNVVMHGYQGDGSGTVRVDAEVAHQAVTVKLTDHAFAFNPLLAPEPDTSLDLEERGIGGLGVHFVRKMSDEIAYRRIETPDGAANELRFVKRFTPPPGTAS